jgi:putative hemolysin
MRDTSTDAITGVRPPVQQGFWPVRRPVRDLLGMPETLMRVGSLELKLAVTKKDVRRAQKMRYRVFFEHGEAVPDAMSALRRRDICPFDRLCDHLLVIDHAHLDRLGRRKPAVVGAYRLLRQDVAERHGGFYSAQEFDVAPLLARHSGKRFLELGRSCVLPQYRSKRTLELLWRGVWAYVRHHRIDAMIGCASLPGADAARHADALAFLAQHASAPEAWSVRALPHRRIAMRAAEPVTIDPRRALAALPPLVKGYLRLGAGFGDGAVADAQFGVTDVFVVMPVADIDVRYVEHFSGAVGSLAA